MKEEWGLIFRGQERSPDQGAAGANTWGRKAVCAMEMMDNSAWLVRRAWGTGPILKCQTLRVYGISDPREAHPCVLPPWASHLLRLHLLLYLDFPGSEMKFPIFLLNQLISLVSSASGKAGRTTHYQD